MQDNEIRLNPRIIVIQKLYGHHLNKDSELSFPKHKYKKFIKDVVKGTIEHFKNHKDCVLIFVRDSNLKSVSETLRGYKSKKYYKSGQDKLIKNYGIGAQIIKALNIKNMILVTRSRKKVIGLEGYGIRITKQEIIKWNYV